MNVRRVDPARSRVVLVGVDAYSDPSIPDEPAIANNITDLVSVLADPALGDFAPEHLLVAPAGAGIGDVGDLLMQAGEEAEDLLLFYYAGHGFPTARRAELCLSLADTRTDRLAFTALPFDAVRDAFLDSRATSRVVILDSCYSGKAIGRTLGAADVLEQLDVAGTYTLTASPATRPAMAALPGERHTAFTGRLLALLRSGTPQAGPDLSLGDIYRQLRLRLRADGLPEPQQRGTATGDLLALTANPGYTPPAPRIVEPAALPGEPGDPRAGQLRPKDIQDRIRAGATAEEVAEACGLSVERIRRFEGPVRAERAFIAERAQDTKVRRQGDSHEWKLGELVFAWLAKQGADDPSAVRWDSWRRDDGVWIVQAGCQISGRMHEARWLFDPPRRSVLAQDNGARQIFSDAEGSGSGSAGR